MVAARSTSRWLSSGIVPVAWLACFAGCTAEPDIVARGRDAGVPDDAGRMQSGRDAGVIDPCDLDGLLERAGIPPEGIIVAATCQLPISWLTSDEAIDVGSQELRALLENSGPIMPTAETWTGQLLCSGSFSGFWYYDNPLQPSTIHLCPDLCDFVRTAVAGRIEDLGCESGLATDGTQPDWPFPFPTRTRPDAGPDDDPDDAGT